MKNSEKERLLPSAFNKVKIQTYTDPASIFHQMLCERTRQVTAEILRSDFERGERLRKAFELNQAERKP